MPEPTMSDAVVYVLAMFAVVFIGFSAVAGLCSVAGWAWRSMRPRPVAKVLPLVRKPKDRSYPRPKGAA